MNPKILIAILLAILTLADTSHAQQPPAGRVFSNGDIPDSKPFTLLVIGVDFSEVVKQPGPQLQEWLEICEVVSMPAGDLRVQQNHPHLIQKHQQLPILAMIDRAGGTWFSVGGENWPKSEAQLCLQLQQWYEATLRAQAEAGIKQEMQEIYPAYQPGYQPAFYPQQPQQTGPTPLRPGNNDRRPLFNPTLDVDHNLNLPTKMPTIDGQVGIEGRLDPDTRRALYLSGGILLLCSIVLVVGLLLAASIIGNAITDDDEDMNALDQVRSVLPPMPQMQFPQNRGAA